MNDILFKIAMGDVKRALDSLYEAVQIYDPQANYSDEQILLIATQVLGAAYPSMVIATEAIDRLGNS